MALSRTAKFYRDNPEAAEKRRRQQRELNATEKEKKKRASRNAARKKMKKSGKVTKGQDVDHKDGNALNNKKSNLKAISASKNRSKK